MADDLLADGRLRDRGIFDDRAKSPGCGREHRDGRADHRHRLWQLLMLELWFRQFVDQAPARAARADAEADLSPCAASPASSRPTGCSADEIARV